MVSITVLVDNYKCMQRLKNIFQLLEKKKADYRIYCDLDGVLVDFEKGLPPFINDKLEYILDNVEEFAESADKSDRLLYRKALKAVDELGGDMASGVVPKMEFKDFAKETAKPSVRSLSYLIVDKFEMDFWSSLDWMPDGKRLWDYIRKYEPTIITSPIGKGEGKKVWVQKNLGVPSDRVILSHHKFDYAEPDIILIDDQQKNTEPFAASGGKAIQHKNTNTTTRKLKKGFGL